MDAEAKLIDAAITDPAPRRPGAEETGADHRQHDNPTIGQKVMADRRADRFGIDHRARRLGAGA